ncbi:SDR family NAD(P)-dependent oxidoreductase [Hymenobacter lapidiphilus]|uniref:SDR family oxidoreductase n=1 Tax=Hymenobacter sp. CCM 8763 TaxID=2303334 RepID=UPI000E340CC9|nr:SDR family oxidoreductase [Hymenobacter sp. CCM 8763]RFP67028.1 SDR family NAD(P)-dependent oxidoreductase [Hymenobacter sp. CCM 8763]
MNTIVSEQIALVTGATSGIGKVTARELVRRGYHIILLARDAAKAARVRQEFQQLAPSGQRVDVLLCDLSDLSQVRRAAEEFIQRYQRLDVLVNNAGLIFGKERETSTDGYEMTLATNHLGPFLLTSLLLPALQQSEAARIVNVASEGYRMAKPQLHDLNQKENYSAWRQYGNTKLYNILFTQELARQLRARGIGNVVTNSLHPGVVASSFGSASGGLTSLLTRLAAPFLLTTEEGARTSIFLATDPIGGQVSGGYFDKQQTKPVKHNFTEPTQARQLWQETEKLVGQEFFGE